MEGILKSSALVRPIKDLKHLDLKSNDVGITKKHQESLVEVFFLGLGKKLSIDTNLIVELEVENYGDGFDEKIISIVC